MKIKVGGEYILDSEKLISFFNYNNKDHKDDILVYMGKYFLYTLSKITGARTYDDSYIFYSEKKKELVYAVQRNTFVLDTEYDSNIDFVNYKENKIFINNKSFKDFQAGEEDNKLHTVWIDEDDFLNNKEKTDFLYKAN